MADTRVTLEWTGAGLEFRAENETGAGAVTDGSGRAGLSPTQHLLAGLAGCMAADIVDIMEKSRTPLASLEARVDAWRAAEPPRRFTRIVLRIIAGGVAEADSPKLQRALDLSRQTYCSVLHTLRPDVELVFELERR